MEVRKVRICPVCGRKYSARPALSRVDNETLICPLCGTKEALEGLGIGEEEILRIMGIVEDYTEV